MTNDPGRLAKWKRVITIEMMSSEDSDSGGSDNEEVFKVKLLTWRSEKVNHFIKTLDRASTSTSTRKSKKMQTKRIDGAPSARKAPINKFKDCLWTIKRAYHPVQQVEEP